MMLFQIACHLKRPLCRQLMLCHSNQICRSHVNQFSKHQVAFYCHSRDPKINAESNKLDDVNSIENEIDEISNNSKSNFKQKHREWDNKANLTFSDRHIEELYPAPLNSLKIFYNIVNTELKKNCISFRYEYTSGSNKMRQLQCIIQVTWPFEMTFTDVAPSKKKATNNAALSCLSWLHQNKKIKGSKPLLYSYEQIQNYKKAEQYVSIDLHSKFKNEIHCLINTFDHKIKSTITPAVVEQNEDNLMEKVEDEVSVNAETSNSIKMRQSKRSQIKRETRVDLPIMNYKEEILNSLENNQVLLIKGDTGCGKSTQVPQFIVDEYIKQDRAHECKVIVSQPRRISAISIAERVASERGECIGDTVGYHVRFNNVTPTESTSILYCTTGILLRKLEFDSVLNSVSHIIIDEAHERSVDTDILMKFFKEMLDEKPHLKLIIMSASINAELFQRYFSCRVIEVPGSLYPVKMHFLDDMHIFNTASSNWINLTGMDIPFDNIARLIEWIIKNKPPGAILCFLPGWPEIKQLYNILEAKRIDNLLLLPLHSKISNKAQQEIFKPAPENTTKIILSTDIAETGITISDISYIIDTAVHKNLEWDNSKYLSTFSLRRISKANILQRKGRAGRIKPGESYHLIKREEYEQLDSYPKPAIIKEPLEGTILICKTLSDKKVHDFFDNMIQSPSATAINNAVVNLNKLGILDEQEELTSLGKRVARLSLSPKLSKALVLSCAFQCLDPILSIITIFSTITSPTVSLDEENSFSTLKAQKLKFHKSSDHIATLEYFHYLENYGNSNSVFVNLKNLEVIKRLRLLHLNDLMNSGLILSKPDFQTANLFSQNNELIRAILFAATNHLIKRNYFGLKKGYFGHNANELLTEKLEKVKIANESVNKNRKIWPSSLLTYISKMEFVKRRSCLAIDTSLISPLSVLLFSSGNVTHKEISWDDCFEENEVIINIDNINNVTFCCKKETADLLLKLRRILWDTVNFIIEYEGSNDRLDDLITVKEYKNDLMNLISNILLEAATNIDAEVDTDTSDNDDDVDGIET